MVRKEGTLIAKPGTDNISNPFKITLKIGRVEEVNATKLVVYLDIPENERQGLPTNGAAPPMELTKVDNDNLEGTLMGSDVTARRLK